VQRNICGAGDGRIVVAAFELYLIKPTRYDDEGYPLQWWRSIVPSNSLACLTGIAMEAAQRRPLGDDVEINIHTMDEINTLVSPKRIVDRIRASGNRAMIGLVGVQSNQFPRAVDLAREFCAADIPVCIGGFHVSGCLAMLKQMPADLVEAQALGISAPVHALVTGRTCATRRTSPAPRSP